jgi:vacuolar-type H+-ATPase subunit C/Vma6
MNPQWDDLIARTRGLGTHLLERTQLEDLAPAVDLADLARRLAALGIRVEHGAEDDPIEWEREFRRRAGALLAILARWAGPRVAALEVIYLDEDRRTLRALLRGLVSGAAPSRRLAGLIPTPDLPLRAQEQLVSLEQPSQLAVLLQAWGNPIGPELAGQLVGPEPDLLHAELALARTWARRARAGGRKCDSMLRQFVTESLDQENLTTALALAGEPPPADLEQWFLHGGRWLTPANFLGAAHAADPPAAADYLVRTLKPCPLIRLLKRQRGDLAGLEWLLLNDHIRRLGIHSRQHPLSSAPVLGFALRVRHELLSLQRILWRVSLRQPVDARRVADEFACPVG